MTETTKANFVLDGIRVEIELTINFGHISFTGVYDGALGQIDRTLQKAYEESVESIHPLEIVLEAWRVMHLQSPANFDLTEVRAALAELNGSRYPEPEEGGRAEDFEEADFSNTDDVIDSRDVIKRIEYLNDFLADLPDDISEESYDPDEDKNGNRNDAIMERIKLRALEEEASGYAPDWRYGETLIHEDHFTDYMEQMTKDIGDLPDKIPGYLVIDWEATANNLKVDYTEVDFDGQTYYIR